MCLFDWSVFYSSPLETCDEERKKRQKYVLNSYISIVFTFLLLLLCFYWQWTAAWRRHSIVLPEFYFYCILRFMLHSMARHYDFVGGEKEMKSRLHLCVRVLPAYPVWAGDRKLLRLFLIFFFSHWNYVIWSLFIAARCRRFQTLTIWHYRAAQCACIIKRSISLLRSLSSVLNVKRQKLQRRSHFPLTLIFFTKSSPIYVFSPVHLSTCPHPHFIIC